MTSSSGLAPSWLENSLGAPPPPRASRSNPRRDNQNQQGSTGSLGSGSGPGGTYVPPSHRANSLSSGGSSYPPRGGSSQVSPPGYSSGRGSSESSRSQRQSHGARPTFDDQYPSLGGSPPGRGGGVRGSSAWAAGGGRPGSPSGPEARKGDSAPGGDKRRIQMVSRSITHLNAQARNRPPVSTAPRTTGVLDRNTASGSFGKATSAGARPSKLAGRSVSAGSRMSAPRPSAGATRGGDARNPSGGVPLRTKSGSANDVTRTVQPQPGAGAGKRADDAQRKRAAKSSVTDIGFIDLSNPNEKKVVEPVVATTSAEPGSPSTTEVVADTPRLQPNVTVPISIPMPRPGPLNAVLPAGSYNEKEERLLREMGWEQDDGTGLTQEEIAEGQAILQNAPPRIKPLGFFRPTVTPVVNEAEGDETDDESSDDD